MKERKKIMLRALCSLAVLALASVQAIAYQDPYKTNQDPYRNRPSDAAMQDDKSKRPPAGDVELQAAKKVQAAVDGAAALQAAGEFLKKYPKSPLRVQVAKITASKISQTEDNAKKLSLAETFTTVFTQPSESDVIIPTIIDAYTRANKFDEAFQKAATWLQSNPDDARTLVQMALVGSDQAKHANKKFTDVSRQYGLKAIELIEADKRPASIEADQWGEYKTRWLSQVYQSVGFLSMSAGDSEKAKTQLQKAISLNSGDPYNYLILGTLYDNEYQQAAEQHKKMMSGPDQDAMLKKALAAMDQVIDAYLHAIALSEGSDPLKKVHDSLLQYVQPYFKYRHNGSTDGLQEAIDKYKKPAGQ